MIRCLKNIPTVQKMQLHACSQNDRSYIVEISLYFVLLFLLVSPSVAVLFLCATELLFLWDVSGIYSVDLKIKKKGIGPKKITTHVLFFKSSKCKT